MLKLKDGRVLLSKSEVALLSKVVETGVEVVDTFVVHEYAEQDTPETRLFAALHAAQEAGLTAQALVADYTPSGGPG